MASIKSDAVGKKRAMLNTTIEEEVLNEFKDYCKELGIPMNVIISIFMQGFCRGSFVLKIAKGNNITMDLDEE